MNMKISQDQGRSMMDELKLRLEESTKSQVAEQSQIQKHITPVSDTFEKTELENSTEQNASTENKLNVSFQFDLFYKLSQKVEATMGQNGLDKFVEVSGQVSETFMGDFSLKIDAVGSFMKSTDSALDISSEVTDEFLDSVSGLADLSPEALENFLQESETFFDGLKETYGEADGTFDEIKEQMQSQAKQFFSDVGQVRQEAIGESEDFASSMIENGTDAIADGSEEVVDDSDPISFTLKPNLEISPSSYKDDFLQQFLNYTQKFQQNMMKNFFDYKPLSLTDSDFNNNALTSVGSPDAIDFSA